MDLTALRSLIVADAALSALAATGADNAIADALNAPSIPGKRAIPIADLITWAADHDVFATIATQAQSQDKRKRGDAATAQALISKVDDVIDMTKPAIADLVERVADSIGTQARAALDALSAAQVSRATAELGSPVTTDQVSESLLPDRPEGRIP